MIRVAITGPESSGKTTLANALSRHFGVTVVPEYGRKFLEENGPAYTQADLDDIAVGHEESVNLSQNSINIIDTDFVVLKIWSEYKYDFASSYINSLVSENHFDLHILCAPDIPWEEDPLRENPDDRHQLFERYVDTLSSFKKDFIIVNGLPEARLKKSIAAINKL